MSFREWNKRAAPVKRRKERQGNEAREKDSDRNAGNGNEQKDSDRRVEGERKEGERKTSKQRGC